LCCCDTALSSINRVDLPTTPKSPATFFKNRAIGVVVFSHPATPPTDQDLIFRALRQVGVIIAEHPESGESDTDEVVTQLTVLDTEELAAAMNRVERRSGLRLTKEIRGAD
jgi:hypothetical protein